MRQHKLRTEAEQQITPAHIEQIMKSGFSISDLKGLHRNYEEAVESDEVMKSGNTNKSIKSPSRPPRKMSLTRNGPENGSESLEECYLIFFLLIIIVLISFILFGFWMFFY